MEKKSFNPKFSPETLAKEGIKTIAFIKKMEGMAIVAQSGLSLTQPHSIREEQGMQIFCLGPEGTYGHQVAHQINKRYFHAQREIVFCKSHEEVFAQLDCAKDPNTIGVVAIRNSTAGLVMEVVRFWLNVSPTFLRVANEVDLPIAGDFSFPRGRC